MVKGSEKELIGSLRLRQVEEPGLTYAAECSERLFSVSGSSNLTKTP